MLRNGTRGVPEIPLSSTSYLLDNYPVGSLGSAYSLRKISTVFTGDCIRVRRSSDNAELDIGFIAGELDTTSLQTFIGVNTGHVIYWWDQSGNGNNIENTNVLIQPEIITSGTLNTLNGKPAIVFANDNLVADGTAPTLTQPYTFVAVNKSFNGYSWMSNAAGYPKVGQFSSYIYWNYGQATYSYSTFLGDGNQHIVSGMFDGATSKLWGDNGIEISSDATTGDYRFGNFGNNGVHQEFIMFDTDRESDISDINDAVNDYYGSY